MSRSSSSRRAAASRRWPPGAPRRRVALVEARGQTWARRAVGAVVLRAGVAVAEVLREVERQRAGQARGLGHRLGMVGEAGGHRCRRREHVAWLPPRRGSEASSVVCSRMATNASCSRARPARARGRCPWPRTARPRRAASAASSRFSARSWRAKGAAARPGSRRARSAQQPAQRRLVAHALARAAAEADQPLGVLLDVAERDRGVAARGVRVAARGGARRQPSVPSRRPAARPLAGWPPRRRACARARA